MHEVIECRMGKFWSLLPRLAAFCPFIQRRAIALSKLVKSMSLRPNFDHSLVVYLVGQNFDWINGFVQLVSSRVFARQLSAVNICLDCFFY